jgi:hypothetical protein
VGVAHEGFADSFDRAQQVFAFGVKYDGGERAPQHDHETVEAQERHGRMGQANPNPMTVTPAMNPINEVICMACLLGADNARECNFSSLTQRPRRGEQFPP